MHHPDLTLVGKGVLFDTGVHLLDRTLWLFGDLNGIAYEDDSLGGFESNARLTGTLHIGDPIVAGTAYGRVRAMVDDRGEPVPDGATGHLLTRGPYTIRGYHNDDAANARSFTDDGYYRTGDMVQRLAGGYLVVQGRATDHINRAGEKISAEEIEDHLLAHPQVFDAAVVSIPDDYLGERSCAFVIPGGEKPRPAELKAWVRGRGLAAFKVPDQIVFVEAFDTTAVGKISRRELRAQLRARFLAEKEVS